MKQFINEDFALQTKAARKLYHDYAEQMPIYDYHCHLPAELIAADHRFENITQAWLYGDHYKWRAMRTDGVDEKYCTGNASDWEKFEKWAQTVPATLRNPLYHWTHLELNNPFGINDKLLNADTAREIYDHCNSLLQKPEFSVRGLLRKFNVKLVCTTDDPLDNLEHHKKIAADGFEIKVYPAFRPDKALGVENLVKLNEWLDKLSDVAGANIKSFSDLLEAIKKRHDYFHENGCRLSDYGLEYAYAENYTLDEIEKIFEKIRTKQNLNSHESMKYKSAVLHEFCLMDAEAGWVMQLHIGALRNNNTRLFKTIGPDTGFDSIGDWPQAQALSRFLDSFDKKNKLPKTILYNLNPADNELFATMLGNFQDGSVPGKIQYGSGWWFLDQKDGMQKQITALSNLGLLSRFVGMVTDSRSFLSFPRHEYFRRVLCNLLGNDIEQGLLPNDLELVGSMVRDISFNNAANYFPMAIG
ncbi:MAG: glucuronate isomerase [Phycisphaerae bacterium]|jgi:glucuronate isomerase